MSDKAKPYTLKEFDEAEEEDARLRAIIKQRDALIRLLTRTLDNCKFWSDDFKDEVRDALEEYDQDN